MNVLFLETFHFSSGALHERTWGSGCIWQYHCPERSTVESGEILRHFRQDLLSHWTHRINSSSSSSLLLLPPFFFTTFCGFNGLKFGSGSFGTGTVLKSGEGGGTPAILSYREGTKKILVWPSTCLVSFPNPPYGTCMDHTEGLGMRVLQVWVISAATLISLVPTLTNTNNQLGSYSSIFKPYRTTKGK